MFELSDKNDERVKNLLDWYAEAQDNYCKFSKLILNKILDALQERKIQIAYYSNRVKTLDSLKEKSQRKVYTGDEKVEKLKYTDPKNQIMDFAGVRIVAYLMSDIPLIKNVVENLFCIDDENSGDKIDELSENEIGYLSMHYIVSLKAPSYEQSRYKNLKCEVQIRTVLQDAWSQIFHDRQYKSGVNGIVPSYELKRKTNLIAGSLELIDAQINNLVNQYDSMNDNILKEVYYQSILDLEISPKSLVEYCRIKFNDRVNKYYSAESVMSILHKYDLKYIRDIDNIVQTSFVEAIMKSDQVTIDKLISYILIIENAEKFFSLLNGDNSKKISVKSSEILSGFVDISNICEKYNVSKE